MKVLFLGGTGIISTASVALALKRGLEVSVLNRGLRFEQPQAKQLVCNVNDVEAAREALNNEHWDVVVDFVCFAPEQVEDRVELFRGKVGQYVFISSASAYQRPVQDYLVTESTPLSNPFWQYSRDKIACEEAFLAAYRKEGFPVTIVRPSLTFGDTVIPLAMNSWNLSYTAVDRMRKGKPVIVPGDGTSLWTITHNTDFAKGLVGLFGNHTSVGHAFHITSDEVLTWDQIYLATARAAGVENPKLVHMASDFIIGCCPDMEGTLLGDKATSTVMDNSKIKRFVPDFVSTTRYEEGIKQTIAAFDADPGKRGIDDEANERYDLLIRCYEEGLANAKQAFAELR